MKHKNMKRLAAAVAATLLSLGAVALPASSAQADTGWPAAKYTQHGNK